MSRALRTIAIVAGAVALIATGIGAAAGIGLITLTTGTLETVATIGAVASAVSVAASLGAAALQKRPALKGSVSQVMIGATMAVPYAIGLTYLGGMQVYDNSGGDKNKYRHQVMVVSAAGPIESFDSFLADYQPVTLSGESATGWYGGFLTVQEKLGARPETAHTNSVSAMPGWSAAHKLSGFASYRPTMLFDKDGERFASGIPQLGVIVKGAKAYDPRADSTYSGGSGAQRWDDEATWAWSENAALHGLTYARGRFENGVKIVGAGIPRDAIDIASFVEAANIDDANEWKVGGAVYEAPDLSKWDNLKRILQAGGAKPIWSGGMLRLHISAPRPSLFRITADDLAEGSVDVQAMKGSRERRNSIVPKYRAPDRNWEYVQGDAVTAATYVAEDGELKTEEVQYGLVQDKDQAAQLAAYDMVNAREFGPVTMSVKPRLLSYRLGEAGTLHIPEAGLFEQLAVITGRSVNPATGVVTLTLESETSAKHAYAMGLTGTAPPTPVIRDSQELDEAVSNGDSTSIAIANSFPVGLTLTSEDDGDIVISNHSRRYVDGTPDVAVTGTTISSGLAAGTFRAISYDDPDRAGGAVTYSLRSDDIDARVSPANPYRHYLGYVVIPTAGSPPADGEGSSPPGGYCVTTDALVLMHDGSSKPAGDIIVGDRLMTRHEATLRWGIFPVEAVAIAPNEPVYRVTVGDKQVRATADHRLFIDGLWKSASELGVADGSADVVKMTVTGAHTYVSNDILSHNIKNV